MNDQAEALRHLVKQQENLANGRATRIITVTSGKGGVGKSNFSLNFALSLQRFGKKVLVFDADISMANIDVLMGVPSPYNLYHLLKGEMTIWDIVQTGIEGLPFIAGGSGFRDLLNLSTEQLSVFTREIDKLNGMFDYIIFDTGAGLSKETESFIEAAHETIVVTTPEPTSITDAYALIKMVKGKVQDVQFKLIVNRATDRKEGLQTADNITRVAQRFLEAELPVLGILPDDPHVSKAVKQQKPFLVSYPDCLASLAMSRLTRAFLEMPQSEPSKSGFKGFMQKMLKLSR